MRVLHLIDAASPQAASTTLALLGTALGRLGDIEQHVLLLGGASLDRAARAAGIVPDERVHRVGVPFGHGLLGWPAVMTAMQRLGRFDILHCWSINTLTLATLARGQTPRLLTVTNEPSPRAVHWLRMLESESTRRQRTIYLPISSTLRRALLTGGVNEAAVHVLRPGIDLSRVAGARRAELRRSWGIDASDDATAKVIAPLCDPPATADAMHLALAVGIVQEMHADKRFHLLLHPDQWRRLRAESLLRHTHDRNMVIRERDVDQPWQVLPGCDVALALESPAANASPRGRTFGTGLSLLWAMASNIPIIGEATYGISEIVEDRHSALLAKPGDTRELVKRITRVINDAQLAYKLRDTARHEAYSFFSRQRYCQSLQGVYEQLAADEPIAIPELQATGGLRFTGRA